MAREASLAKLSPTPAEPHRQVTWVSSVMGDTEGQSIEHWLTTAYDELRRLAAHKMATEPPGHTLQPTALVHEAWLRLSASPRPQFKNRAHFFAAAAEVMRRTLVDRARRRLAAKRGTEPERVALDNFEIAAPRPTAEFALAAASARSEDDQLLRLNDALESLARIDPRKAELVKLRYFAGLSFAETAATLEIAIPTAKQWWAFARAWLRLEVNKLQGENLPPMASS